MSEQKEKKYDSKFIALKMVVGYSLVGIYFLLFILLVASLSSN